MSAASSPTSGPGICMHAYIHTLSLSLCLSVDPSIYLSSLLAMHPSIHPISIHPTLEYRIKTDLHPLILVGFSSKSSPPARIPAPHRIRCSSTHTSTRTYRPKSGVQGLGFRVSGCSSIHTSTHTYRPKTGVDMGDHPPITPCRYASSSELYGEQGRLYDLVVKHFIASVSPDAVYLHTRIYT